MVALLIAACVAGAVAIFGTKVLMDLLIARKLGQPIHEDMPEGHTVKAGTPTMGGLAIVGAAAVGYVCAHIRGNVLFTRTGLLVMAAIIGAGLVGLVDDWIKVSNERNVGLSKRAKTLGLLVVAVAFAVASVLWTDVETTLSFTRWNSPGWELGNVGWCVWAVLLIYATTNGVNLTDGLDGLAAGSAILAFSCLMAIGFWAFRHFDQYQVNHALDLAVIAAAMVGACAGFLWWNAAPARIFMGDTGALAIGAGDGRPRAHAQRAAAAPHRRRAVRHGDAVGDDPGDELPPVQAPRVPHGAHPPPLRARRLARDDRDRAVLAPRGRLRRPRPRALLRRLHQHRRARLTEHLVLGLGVTGQAVLRALVAHGESAIVVDDAPTPAGRALADELGVRPGGRTDA